MWGRGEEGLFFRHNAPRRMVTPKVVWRSRRPYITRVVAIKPRVLSARGRGRRGGGVEGGEKLNRRFDNFSFILFLLHSILAINTRIYIETFRRRKRVGWKFLSIALLYCNDAR